MADVTVFLEPAVRESGLSAAYAHLLMKLFAKKRISKIAIRARDGTRLTDPLVLTEQNLADLLPALPSTEDELLAAYVANMLAEAVDGYKKLPAHQRTNPFSDVTRVIWEAQKPIRELTGPVREIIITWLDLPHFENTADPFKPRSLFPEPVSIRIERWQNQKPRPPDEYEGRPEALRELIERWKRQEPGTCPPRAPESS